MTYYCGLCGEPTEEGDADHVRAVEDDPGSGYHVRCAQQIADALAKFKQARGRCVESTRVALEPRDLEPLESRVRRLEAVWKLWLNDAEKGTINPGTFNTMKTLLGIEE